MLGPTPCSAETRHCKQGRNVEVTVLCGESSRGDVDLLGQVPPVGRVTPHVRDADVVHVGDVGTLGHLRRRPVLIEQHHLAASRQRRRPVVELPQQTASLRATIQAGCKR